MNLVKNAGSNKLISILMPVYNCAETIDQALESILNQTYQNIEVILLDDGSTDDTQDRYSAWLSRDSRVSVYKQKNSGIVAALNKALSLAKGHYIARMDGDDISVKHRLEKQIKYMEANPDVALSGTFYTEIPSGKKCIMPSGKSAVKKYLRNNGNAFVHSSVIMRAEIFNELQPYRNNFPHCEDYDLWLRIAEKYEVDNLPEYLIDYRRHSGSVSYKNLEQQFLSASGARRCAQLRRNGFPDPAMEAGSISLEQLDIWGLRIPDVSTEMIGWLEWNFNNLSKPETDSEPVSAIDELIAKYRKVRAGYNLALLEKIR